MSYRKGKIGNKEVYVDCIDCGKPGVWELNVCPIDTGHYYPYCDRCVEKHRNSHSGVRFRFDLSVFHASYEGVVKDD